jgi:hypothetical protein
MCSLITELNKTKKGGFIFNLFSDENKISTSEYGKYMGNAIKTEDLLIKKYEEFTKAAKEYNNIYNEHIKNIESLEEQKGMTSLLSTFKDTVLPNDILYHLKIDRTNPLLLRNYLVTDDTLPKNFRREHVLNQIRYVISKFKPADKILIDSIGNVRIDGTTCLYTVRASNGDKFEKKVRINDDYIIDTEDVDEQITELIGNLKSKIDFDIELVDEFEVGDNIINIPGLHLADPEDILKAKLNNIKGSVRAQAVIEPIKPESKQEKAKAKQSNRVIYSVGTKTPSKLENLRKNSIARNAGENARLDPEKFKQEPQPEIADQLKKIFNPDIQQPEQQQLFPQQVVHGQIQQQQFQQQQFQPQLQQEFPMQRTFNSPMLKQQPFYAVDPTEQFCRTMSNDPSKCYSHPMCYYSPSFEPDRRCHKDVKATTAI